jgi:hypothetical protein
VWALPVRVMQGQLLLIYVYAALEKWGGAWAGGVAVYRALHSTEYARRAGLWLGQHPLMCGILTQFTRVVEGLFAPLVLSPVLARPARAVALVGGLLLHGGIFVTMRVGLFSPLMVSMYLLFLYPEWIDALLGARSAPARPLPRPRVAALVALVLGAHVLAITAQLAGERFSRRYLAMIGLTQDWRMFSPDPPVIQLRFSAPGLLADGTARDALEAAPGLLRDDGAFFSRWQKLRTNAADNRTLILQLGQYLCRRYNSDGRGVRLARFDMVLETTRIVLPGEPPDPPLRITLLHQPCRNPLSSSPAP